jgi:peptide-methionine (R)-S-oxide reductase
MRSLLFFVIITLSVLYSGCGLAQSKNSKHPDPTVAESKATYPIQLTDAQWKAKLTPAQYYILRQQGTEPAGSGKYDHFL